MPDEEVHAFINHRLRTVTLQLFGRRMYETMKTWEAAPPAGASAATRDFAAI
jgi:hypothetical protein